MANSVKYNFETPPDPVPDSEIVDTLEAEVIVIGAGTAGLVCANSAVENGLKVVLISASSHPISRGGSNHAINSKLQRELGIHYDVEKNIKREIDRAGGRIDQDKWYLFANKSGEAMDWLIDKMVAEGYTPILEMPGFDPDGILSTYPGSHCFCTKIKRNVAMGQPLVVNTLASLAQAAGVRIHYKTIAKQLVRENNNTGRVTAVIAQNPEGKYIKYTGSKAIVLATGDFTRDREMVSMYCPEVLPLISTEPVNYDTQLHLKGGIYAGDGHKMGLWVGAAWQQTVPNAPNLIGGAGPHGQPYSAFKGLAVNKLGVRYCSEDVNGCQAGLIQLRQPDFKVFAIWDVGYAERMAPWYPQGYYYGGPPIKTEEVITGWETLSKYGKIVKANSIGKLADGLGLDADTLIATVDRYNSFCEKGKDEDFYKRAGLLIPVKKAPFYGQVSNSPDLLMVCGGLRTNIKMQVLDTKNNVIPGLYAVGTIVGDMFANYYTFIPSGINLGATCITFGYLVGKEIAGT
jgi:succinate dehydrogenase/fumarate reductase flavoprotein subunit